MKTGYQPGRLDYFPRTRRGHGTTHPLARFNKAGTQTRAACECVNPACSRLRRQDASGKTTRGEAHDDQYANVADWREEHGYRKDTPLEECR